MKVNHSSPTPLMQVYQTVKQANKALANPDTLEKITGQDAPDTLSLSDQAKKLLEAEQVVQDISKQMEAAAESKGSPYDELTKCLLIASRIMKGEKVPQADVQFLAETEPELYSSAMLMKQTQENPKRHKSVLENEGKEQIVEDPGKAELAEALAHRPQVAKE